MSVILNNKTTQLITGVAIIVFSLFFGSVSMVSAEVAETYETEGMEFTIGKHKPEKRVNPKKGEFKTVTQTIVVNQDGEPVELPGIDLEKDKEEEEKKDEELIGEVEGEKEETVDDESSFSKVIKEILTSIKELWAKLITFEKKTEGRLNTIEGKLDTPTNVEELTGLTTQMMDELEAQEKRIIELEVIPKK